MTCSAFAACATTSPPAAPELDRGVLWVNHAAEYRAISRLVYQDAAQDLPRFVDDRSWTVLPGEAGLRDLPPAVILDVDETVVSNAAFQASFVPPVTQLKIDTWNREHMADPVPGVVEFVTAAKEAGVTVFFVTNRPCERIESDPRPCPYRDTIIDDLREMGIESDEQHVLLSSERGWTREKLSRRQHVAKTHRIIMLIGDDLSDFIPCVRDKALPPCTTLGSKKNRRELTEQNARFWGNGWYILPNPMHGSWTDFAN